jgi:chemotaxis signal transduction protein
MNAAAVTGLSIASTFRPGAVALRIHRGNTHFLLPRLWVRGVVPLTDTMPLPRAKHWVVGLTVYNGRPTPMLDLAVCAGTADTGYAVGVLLGAADQEPFALVVADGADRFVSVPASASIETTTSWLARMQGCSKPTWWLDAGRLAVEFKS